MAVDETATRIERVERQIQEMNDSLRRALDTRSNGGPSAAAADRSVQDIMAQLAPEERQLIEDHRAFEQYKRLRTRRLAEEEKEALLKKASQAEAEEAEEEESDDRPKPKAKPKAKAKPASRHPEEEPEEKPEHEPKPEEKPPWWKRD